MNEIANLFKKVRMARKQTRAEFARDLGCTRQAIFYYETGSVTPSADKYAAVLEMEKSTKKYHP